jgi:hypothetical protein
MAVEVERIKQKLLSVPNAGKYSDWGPWKIRRYIYGGLLTPYTPPGGRQVYVLKEELDNLIEECRGKRPPTPCREREVNE